MKWVDYESISVGDYRYACLDLVCIEHKCLLHFEIEQSRSRYFCLATQFGGDSLFRVSANIWRVGFDFCIWGYG